MKLHPNARTTPRSRSLIVDRVIRQGWTHAEAAGALDGDALRLALSVTSAQEQLVALLAATDRSEEALAIAESVLARLEAQLTAHPDDVRVVAGVDRVRATRDRIRGARGAGP
jgi:hypothetical protein